MTNQKLESLLDLVKKNLALIEFCSANEAKKIAEETLKINVNK